MEEDRKSNCLGWDRIDEFLKAKFLVTHKPVCHNCQNFGHKLNECPHPIRRRSSAFTSTVSSGNSTRIDSSSGHRLNSPKIYFCYDFNNKGSCDSKDCKFTHICMSCGKNHAKVHCPTRNN